MGIASFLAEPRLKGLDVESPERIRLHLEILRRKPLLRSVFEEFYRTSLRLDQRFLGGSRGLRVELGAGVSFFKEIEPSVLVTDIKPAPHLDAVVDAQSMPFASGGLRVLYAINCFHHVPDPVLFFREVARVLAPGGGVVLVEPFHGPLSAAVHRRLFETECFDPDAREWASAERKTMVGANQALSYVIFVRDRPLFEELFPELEIVAMERVDNYVRYLFSGGLNFRQLLPVAFEPIVRGVERALRPVNRLTALHHAIVLRKRAA